jgi:hypothetical protein
VGSVHSFVGVLSAVLVILALGLPWLVPLARAHGEAPEELFEGTETLLVPFDETPGVRQDGVIDDGEYDPYGHWIDEEEGVHLYLEHDGTTLYVALVNGLGGWAAVGFGESGDSPFDAKVVWWNGTAGVAEDRFLPAVSDELETLLDVNEAGTDDLGGFAASSDDAAPVFEFRLPLEPDDVRDVALEQGHLHSGFVAFSNETVAPESLAGGDAHFFQLYVLRSTNDPAQIHELFEGGSQTGSALTLAAVAVLALGVAIIGWRLFGLPWRGRK